MRAIDNLLNKITMYRLVLYELIFLLGAAALLGFFGFLPYTPATILFSAAFITAISWIVNKVFAQVFEAPSNPESVYITALILSLIITPPGTLFDANFLTLAFWAAALAMASKYILAIRKKHLFNPAAIAVVITALVINQSASWWVGSLVMLPFVFAGGLLVVRKIQRFELFFAFVASAIISIAGITVVGGHNAFTGISNTLFNSPLFFLASVMLTEPLTTPPTKWLQVGYGIIVGFLFTPAVHVGALFTTPELALVAGNIFSYLVSSKQKLVLILKNRVKLSPDVYEFVFSTNQKISFKPGQYMEWTLSHPWSDTRGVRRYFTLSSSPTENEVRLGVKFYARGSSFKKKLFALRAGDSVVASQLSGDFVLPKNKKEKLAFIAGGIGVTPFRSMIRYLIDTKDSRSTVLLYANKTPADVVYQELFHEAQEKIGLKTVYAFDNPGAAARSPGVVSSLDAETIVSEVPDYLDRTFYLSGPRGMVVAFDDTLRSLGVHERNIKKDFFPGFA